MGFTKIMQRKYNFISGLPRAGSTLLSAILKQNPRFTAGISDPLHMYARSVIKDTGTAAGMESAVSVDKRRELIRGLFDSFYSDGSEVCFNTNRGWASDTALLKNLFPDFKMIVVLREIPWILDSFERLNANNPYTIKPLYHHQDLGNVYDRTHMLMGNIPNFAGYVAGPIANVRHSMACAERHQILYVEYDTLVRNTKLVMQQIYQFLEEPYYEHDFENVEDSYDEFDAQAKITGLHQVKKRVEFKQRETILPDDLYRQYDQASFWKNDNSLKTRLKWATPNFNAHSVRKILPNLSKQL